MIKKIQRRKAWPKWVRFVARDEAGELYGYENEPMTGGTIWCDPGFRCIRLNKQRGDWTQSLRRVVGKRSKR